MKTSAIILALCAIVYAAPLNPVISPLENRGIADISLGDGGFDINVAKEKRGLIEVGVGADEIEIGTGDGIEISVAKEKRGLIEVTSGADEIDIGNGDGIEISVA
ncbi:hypothetical protein K402DRAFT_403010 [Aulographum hederae CBS 113979]|uniref:Uncharacterized protein n=1 Tax=Aulographum hederae CBS 113979 TaxID=1176131 RepID=A0A6G1H5N3_9PEZI|nr:hypothetical protein K402DRAFT_403010 [Aulographum hederae CBS 113979]